jgi:hypothetical protein
MMGYWLETVYWSSGHLWIAEPCGWVCYYGSSTTPL